MSEVSAPMIDTFQNEMNPYLSRLLCLSTFLVQCAHTAGPIVLLKAVPVNRRLLKSNHVVVL